MLEYPKIKKRFPIAHRRLSELSLKTGITEIRKLIFEYLRFCDSESSFSLVADLKKINDMKNDLCNNYDVVIGINPEQLFGSNIKQYSKKDRLDRWQKIITKEKSKKLNIGWFLYDDEAISNETCLGCKHRNKNWCELQGLPTNYNPIIKGIGMACMGTGFSKAEAEKK